MKFQGFCFNMFNMFFFITKLHKKIIDLFLLFILRKSEKKRNWEKNNIFWSLSDKQLTERLVGSSNAYWVIITYLG